FFEMITGHHPFRTDSPLETAAAIIGLDTPPLPESLGEFRDSITSFLMTVLAKDVEQRPGSFKQIRESLLALLEETTAVQLMDLPLTRQVPTGILAGGIIIITAMILMVVQLIGKSTRSDSLGTFGTPESFLVTPLVRDRAPSWHPVPGTDLIVFESDKDGNFDVCMDNLDGDPTNLTHENPGFDGKPVWSPDGNSIAYVSDRQGLGIYIMDSKGFSDKKVTDLSRLPGEFGWRMSWRHPEWIVYSNQRPDDKKWNIYAVSPDGKRLRNLTEQWDMNAYCADLTINGRYLLIIGGGLSGGLVDRRLFVMDLDSGKVLDLFPDQADERSTAIANPMQYPQWDSTDRYAHYLKVEWNTYNLWYQEVDLKRWRAVGEPLPRTSAGYFFDYDLSPSDDQAAICIADNAWSSVMQFREDDLPVYNYSQGTRVTPNRYLYNYPRYSADGDGYFALSTQYGSYQLIYGNFQSSENMDLSERPLDFTSLTVDPSGHWVVANTVGGIPFRMNIYGDSLQSLLSGRVAEECDKLWVTDWYSMDNKIAFQFTTINDTLSNLQIGWAIFNPETGAISDSLHMLPITGSGPQWSPDGQHLAFQSNRKSWIVGQDGTSPRMIGEYGLYGWSSYSGYVYYGNAREIWRIMVGASGESQGSEELWARLSSPDRFHNKFDFHEEQILLIIQHQERDLSVMRARTP
ncbi:hypothetical protein ACFL6T_06685, partial [Candidatus Zixiibacteriota bacterium]